MSCSFVIVKGAETEVVIVIVVSVCERALESFFVKGVRVLSYLFNVESCLNNLNQISNHDLIVTISSASESFMFILVNHLIILLVTVFFIVMALNLIFY